MKGALAFVVVAPFATWLVSASAAHPTLVTLVPLPLERIGAVVFVIVAGALALGEILGRRKASPAYRAGIIFAAVAIAASVLGFDPVSGIASGVFLAVVCLAGGAVYRCVREGSWNQMLAAWLWTGSALCVLALVALVLRKPANLYAFAHGRAVGIFENPNELALYALAVCTIAAAAMLAHYRGRALAIVTFAVAFTALIATGSRSGEAAFAIGVVALTIMLRGGRTKLQLAAVVAIVAVGISLGLVFDSRHNPGENDTRLAAWSAGVRTVALFPLTGVGIGGFYRVYPFVRSPDAPGPGDPIAYDPHNFYLSVAAETGLLGLGAFIWTIVAFVRESREVLALASDDGRRFGIVTLAGLLAIACHLVFNGFVLAIVLWVVMAALMLGIARSEYGRA
ncbi:MAG: O-antigen ligase family protein [Vulcanimicrobiaceae bacterium]|jgi:O-antigen ligase